MPRDGPSGSTGAEEQPVHEVKILTTGKALKLEPFRVPEDPLKVGRAWQEWLEDFEEETNYFEIKEIRDKVGALKIYGGSEIKRLARHLPDSTEEGDDDFTRLIRKLNNHFLPRKNKHHARYVFSKQRMEPGEMVVQYVARLREKSRDCEFGEQTDERILEHVIQTTRDDDLIKRAIQKKWNLDQFVNEASQKEDINKQVRDMKDEYRIAKLSNKPGRERRENSKGRQEKGRKRNQKSNGGQPCKYCGKKDTHRPGENCPAYGKRCHACGKNNHFAVCCRSDSAESKPRRKTEQLRKTGKPESSESDSDSEYFHLATRHVRKVKSNGSEDTVTIRVGDVDTEVERHTQQGDTDRPGNAQD